MNFKKIILFTTMICAMSINTPSSAYKIFSTCYKVVEALRKIGNVFKTAGMTFGQGIKGAYLKFEPKKIKDKRAGLLSEYEKQKQRCTRDNPKK